MPRNSEEGLYGAIESIMKGRPNQTFDCHELFEKPTVREHAETANRVSDYLGNLWRKGLLLRLPAPKDGTSRARWVYQWKGGQARDEAIVYRPPAAPGEPSYLMKKPTIEISEQGGEIYIELPHLSIIISPK